MKTTILKFSFVLGLLFFVVACSTKRNSWLSRNSHALSTEYNILYNGGIALDAGVNELKTTYSDNFWEMLPVERMQPEIVGAQPETPVKNANFDRAETKAIKAIQKHSMNIGGSEKNPQMDEAHLMLGKARYYDKRYVPALEAFNYVLYKYPKSSKIYEVKIWREKTNMRMENDALAVNNLRKLLSEIKFKDQIFADANATLAQAFLNLEEKDSAIVKLRLATEFTKENEEKARYRFILGQLFEQMGEKDSAFVAYQDVIDMNRKSPRMYVIQAHARQAAQFDYEKGDTLAFIEKYRKLLKDRENRPYLGVLNHQMALFYDKRKKADPALKYYNKSLDAKTQDPYLTASNYRNIADIYFDKAKYVTAGMYYDSTLVHLEPRTREFKLIEKKRENLVDVIKYEGIATRNDSIIKVWGMPKEMRVAYYEEYIAKLKKDDELKAAQAEKEREKQEALSQNQNAGKGGELVAEEEKAKSSSRKASTSLAGAAMANTATPGKNGKESTFYFYNPTTVAFGKNEFRKTWGDRQYKNDWRFSKNSGNNSSTSDDDKPLTEEEIKVKEAMELAANEKYTSDFYLKQLPTTQKEIDSIAKERNFAYYQLGVIYKEKFKEYQLAASKLEQLLNNNPEERLVLPSLYNLYKIYEIIDKDKALVMKNEIISQYPDSRYAQILGNSSVAGDANLTPEAAYNKLYKVYESGDYKTVLTSAEAAIDQYTGEEMLSKFELLKAHTIGKLKGLEEYKKALNYVALTYPNNAEGKQAELLLGRDIVILESLQFNDTEPKSWKILYRAVSADDKNVKILQEKIKKFNTERTSDQLTQSFDIYTMDQNFVVMHGIKTEEGAKGIASVLKEFKEYKVAEIPIVISSDNYRVVQIKKNLEEYLADPHKPAEKRAAPVLKPLPETEKAKVPRGARVRKQEAEPAKAVLNAGQAPPGIGMPPQDNNQKPQPSKQSNPPSMQPPKR